MVSITPMLRRHPEGCPSITTSRWWFCLFATGEAPSHPRVRATQIHSLRPLYLGLDGDEIDKRIMILGALHAKFSRVH